MRLIPNVKLTFFKGLLKKKKSEYIKNTLVAISFI